MTTTLPRMPTKDLVVLSDYLACIPRQDQSQYEALKADIQKNGIRKAITINSKKVILDGHTRKQIAEELGILEVPYEIEDIPDPFDEKEYVIVVNTYRRQMNTAQLANAATLLLANESARAADRQAKTQGQTKGEKGTKGLTKSKQTTVIESQLVVPNPAPQTKNHSKLPESILPSRPSMAQLAMEGVKLLEAESERYTTRQAEQKTKKQKIIPPPKVETVKEKGKAVVIAAKKVGVGKTSVQQMVKLKELAKTNENAKIMLEQILAGKKTLNSAFRMLKQASRTEKEEKTTEPIIIKRNVITDSALTKEEWTEFTSSIWKGYKWQNSYNFFNHPAAFPDEIPRRLVKMFSFVGETVLDPFCGTGVTIFEADKLGRNGRGLDASEEYITKIKKRSDIDVQVGDARKTDLSSESVHLIITSPPYWDAIEYDNSNENNIGKSQSLEDYYKMMETFGREMYRILVKDRCMCIVIQDSHRKDHEITHHVKFIQMYESMGFKLAGTWIWEHVNSHLGKPYGSYLSPYKIYPYHMFEYILVFRKNGEEK
jgi:DNA modification methylase